MLGTDATIIKRNAIKLFFISVWLIASISCKSPNEKSILEKFKSVDSSLNATNDSIRSASITKTFDTTGKSLHNLFDSAHYLIYVLKNEMQKKDPGGEQFGISDSLIQNKSGHQLYDKMSRIYALEKNGNKGVNNEILLNKDQWLKQYFKDIPTIAAITILSKFINDIDLIQSKHEGR